MKKIYQLLFCYLLVYGFAVSAQTKVIPYQQLSTSSGLYFGASMTTSSITITFEGPADRWIAFGFGSFMDPADVLIYSNGQSSAPHTLSWKDYYNSSTSSSGVNADLSQDWNIVSTGSVSSQRTVTATRALSTGDASDVAINFTSTALSLIWARGATADYTIAYHGSTNRGYGISLPWLSPPTASFSVPSTTVCQGSAVTFTNLSSGGQTTYTWTFASGSPASSTATNPSISYATPGSYSVVLTASNALGSDTFTQVNYITVTPTVASAVSIALSGGTNPICSGALATFTAGPTNGGTTPSYQWKINGVNAGTNSQTFTTTSLTNGAQVTCVMTSNAVCPNPTNATSAAVTMSVNSSAPATVVTSLTAGSNPMCNGALASFQAIVGNGGTNPSYQWQVNGINAGGNSATFTTNTLSNGNIVTCILTSNAPCASVGTATSSGITMTVSSVLTPSVTLALTAGNNPMCAGNPVSFSASPVNGGNTPVYHWQVNGVNAGTTAPVFTASALTASAVISCTMISGSSCASPTSASASMNMTVNPIPPAPVISPSGTVIICAGTSHTLSSSAASGNLWSDGSTTQNITVSVAGNYTVTQTVNGCLSPPSSVVTTSIYTIANATLDPVGPFCFDSDPIQLQGIPTGGAYSGPGIVGNMFDPSQANIGSSNVIIYTNLQNLGNNTVCSDTAAIHVTILDCTSIGEEKQSSSFISIYPNPGTGRFIISSPLEKIERVTLFDLTGKEILSRSVKEENYFDLDLSAFPSGVYIAEITLPSKVLRSRINKAE